MTWTYNGGDWREKMDAENAEAGVSVVKSRIATGYYPNAGHKRHAEDWVRQREDERAAQSENAATARADRALTLAEEANGISRDAGLYARVAIAISLLALGVSAWDAFNDKAAAPASTSSPVDKKNP